MLSNAIDAAKQVAHLAQEYGKLDLYEKAIELTGRLKDAAEENLSLSEKIRKLEDHATLKATLTFRDSAYWIGKAELDFSPTDGPYCSKCFDGHVGLIRLHCLHQRSLSGNCFKCPSCQTTAVFVYPSTTRFMYACCNRSA